MFISVNNLLKMGKWLKGATEPKGKREQTSEEHAEQLKEYEANRCKCSFCVEWKVNSPWLWGELVDENKNLCSVITVQGRCVS